MRGVEVNRREETGKNWKMINGDSVEELQSMPAESIDFSVYSPPFASLYTYSDSPRDMGNCRDDKTFFDHFGFLAGGMARVIKPGRLMSFHCMALPTTKCRNGFIGLRDFPGDLIRIFEKAGFYYHSEVTIWKDPVTAMQRTKAIGLLYKQLRKDSSLSRQGIPDKLITMRRHGENASPITKTFANMPVGPEESKKIGGDERHNWQNYASPVWMDINPSKTLQAAVARSEKDERHICPLQLEVIERAMELWSNPGDTVLSPFGGIGSEGYQSLLMGRKYIGIELKDTYYTQACINLNRAAQEAEKVDLFEDQK